MPSYLFKYQSSRETHDRVLDDLFRSLTECGVDDEQQHAISIAVSEAFTNAVVHGNREDTSKEVILSLQVNDRQVAADIIDQGKGGLKRVESRKPSGELDEGGRGVDLIRHYASACEFTETEKGGLRVSLCFLRTRKRIRTI